ncbi:MAG: hypothetical protein ISF22_00830 [Methanomassiliicoccus sp.]|nr:hypothetical protein [Methanomassiliicoccus sp.]
MNKRNAITAVALVLFLVAVVGTILVTQWEPGALTSTNNDELSSVVFDQYGLAILIVGITLFVSMLGGVYIAQEEEE